ncbi:MAG: hypothetical protein WCP69_15345 [Bacteroidota bacterium]|jgi:hypothetical protein
MKISYFYRAKPKTSSYKPVFYTPEDDQSSLKKKMSIQNDDSITLRERMDRRWDEERKHKAVSQQNILKAFAVIAILIYIIFFL